MSGSENSGNGGPKYNQEGTFPVFSNEQTARVPGHGLGSHGVQKQAPNRESKLPEILDKIKDPKVSVAEVTRLIAVEMTLITQDMRTCESEGAAVFKLKSCMAQIRALRAVAEAAKEADAWTKRDVFDFDGPKFQYVFGEFSKEFKKAALTVLRDDTSTVKSIMMHLRDNLAMRDEEIRRETEKINYDMDAPSADLASQEVNKPLESSKNEIQQCIDPSSTIQLHNEQTTDNGAADDATANRDDHNDHSEPKIESEADKRLKHPETSPTVPMTSQPRTKDGAGDKAAERHNERNDHREPENESGADENLKRPETSPTLPSLHKRETKNGAPKKATAHPNERSDHSEPEDDILPLDDLIESEADRAVAKEVRRSIIEREESDWNESNDEVFAINAKTIGIKTKDGVAPCHFFVPKQNGKRPAVIFYMDGIGIRPALCDMAERLASNGYHVLLPNLYYRSGPTKPFDAATAFEEGPERDRLTPLFLSLNNKIVMEDTASFLDFLQLQPSVAGQKIGCVGYCMGGAFALSAAGTFPERIAATASLHGARLATDQPDSPHLLASKMRAGIYVGIAGIDPNFTPEERWRLESAFQSAGVRYTVEVYPDVKHGFAVNDTPVYDRLA